MKAERNGHTLGDSDNRREGRERLLLVFLRYFDMCKYINTMDFAIIIFKNIFCLYFLIKILSAVVNGIHYKD